MVVDYEAAWIELQELVASKSQHGREPTLTAMAELAAKHRVLAGELSRLLRLYGVEVQRARAAATESGRDELADFAGGDPSLADDELPEHHRSGGHDVRSNGAGSALGR